MLTPMQIQRIEGLSEGCLFRVNLKVNQREKKNRGAVAVKVINPNNTASLNRERTRKQRDHDREMHGDYCELVGIYTPDTPVEWINEDIEQAYIDYVNHDETAKAAAKAARRIRDARCG